MEKITLLLNYYILNNCFLLIINKFNLINIKKYKKMDNNLKLYVQN